METLADISSFNGLCRITNAGYGDRWYAHDFDGWHREASEYSGYLAPQYITGDAKKDYQKALTQYITEADKFKHVYANEMVKPYPFGDIPRSLAIRLRYLRNAVFDMDNEIRYDNEMIQQNNMWKGF